MEYTFVATFYQIQESYTIHMIIQNHPMCHRLYQSRDQTFFKVFKS